MRVVVVIVVAALLGGLVYEATGSSELSYIIRSIFRALA